MTTGGGGELESETIVTINCSGEQFKTILSTLRVDSESKIYSMFSSKNLGKFLKDPEGRFFIDLNPNHFRFVLDYLRIVRNLKNRKGVMRPSRYTDEIVGPFRMNGREYQVREIYLGENSDSCSADELLEHVLPTNTEDMYGVIMQAEYFGLYHLKSLLAKRLGKGNSQCFLMEDMLEALNSSNGEAEKRPKTRQERIGDYEVDDSYARYGGGGRNSRDSY